MRWIVLADEASCWQAVVERDPGANGRFVYAVTTTGVYCRPSCPTPTPRRRNVRFFGDGLAAQAAGFRECKRCRPRLASASASRVAAMTRACELLSGSERAPSLASLAVAVGISPFHLHRMFSQTVGVTPGEYAKTARLQRLVQALDDGRPVTEAIYAAGYGSISRAYDNARGMLGMTPAERRAGGAGQSVRFATFECSLGWALIAATDHGLCAIESGADPEDLEDRLRRRLPRAHLERGTAEFAASIGGLVRQADLSRLTLALPPAVRSTAYEARIRKRLRSHAWHPRSGAAPLPGRLRPATAGGGAGIQRRWLRQPEQAQAN